MLVVLELGVNNVCNRSDSILVFSGLEKGPYQKPFVSHRVAIIQKLIFAHQRGKVPSSKNPADSISSGLYPSKLLEFQLWSGMPFEKFSLREKEMYFIFLHTSEMQLIPLGYTGFLFGEAV